MKQPSINISRLHPLPGCKPVKALAILCVLLFVALSVHATVVPDKYLTVKYLRYDASAKTYYWEARYATSANADFPEVLEFPTRLVDENDKDKKSYAIREVSIILKEKTKKVIFHSGLKKTSVSYESNSPIESIEYLGANTIAYIYLKNCKTIKEATLPKTLLRDGFINCTALEKVTFLEGCAEIPSLWFASCSALKTIVWPSTMKKIGNAAFEYAGLETLTLPEGFNSLGERCFKNSKLVNVVLPNSLTEIPREAFYNCRRLQTVQMSDNVTSIGVSAFDNCAYLTTMNMPLSIETIGNSAFSGCETWKYEGEMKTPNLKSIGHSVFYLCSSLNCDYTVPHLWDKLPNSIFRCSGFKSLTLSEGITSIEHSAFLNSNTQTYNLPKSLKEMGSSAFREAYVKEVNFAPGTSLEKIDKYTFEKCIKLEAVNNLPSDLKMIEEYAFNGCYNLKALSLPEGLTTIGINAFYGCKAIESMNLPNSLTTLGDKAFYECKMWNGEISLPLITDVPNGAFYSCQKLRKVSFGPQLKSIGSSALCRCEGITEFNLPNGLETIESGAFYGCNNLTEVVMPESVTSIGSEVFAFCSALKKVTLPSSLTDIPDKLFYACDVLNDIVIPTSVKTMGRGVFSGCKALERMTIGDGVTIGNNLFSDCESLKEVKLPATLTTIPEYTFNKCVSLKKVEFPTGLMSIERYAFEGSGIEEVVVPETVTNIASSFANCKGLIRFVFPKNLETIENSMFRNCELLADITLPTNVKTIGSYAFAGTLFDKSELPATVNSLGYNAFENCKQLKEMFIPEGVTSIPEELFMSCTSLTRVVLPSTVNKFYGGNTFKDCPLTDIVCHAPTAPEAENYVFEAKHYSSSRLIVPEGSNYNDKYPWSRFNQKKEAAGFITLANPVLSKESCTFTDPITVTITNPNATGTIYYKLVPDGTEKKEVPYVVYVEPLTISEQSATIYAYIIDGLNSSEYVKNVYTYKAPVIRKVSLEICGMTVDEKNCNDVLGDKGSVVYDPKSEELTLTWATIDATKYKEIYSAINGGGGDLTIRVVGHCTLKSNGYGINYGVIGMEGGGGNLTIVGDDNSMLNIEMGDDAADAIYSYLGNLTIDNCAVIINGGWSGVFMKYGMEGENGVFTIKGENALLNSTGKQAAIMNIGTLVLDEGLEIVVPEGGVFFDHTIYLGDVMQRHVVIRSTRNDNMVDVPVTRGDYDSNFSSTMVDATTGETTTLQNVVIDNVFFNVVPDNGDGYDATEKCIVLNTTMDLTLMNRVPTEANSYEVFADWYNGMTMVLNGKGTLTIDCRTLGATRLGVKIGEAACQYYTANERNAVEVDYDLATPQYVYIFAAPEDTDIKKAPARVAAGKSSLMVYGLKVAQTHAYICMPEEGMYTTYTPMVNIDLNAQTDLSAYTVQVTGDKLMTTQVTGKVPAGTGLLVRRNGKTTNVAVPLATGATDVMQYNDLVPVTSVMYAADLAKVNGYILMPDAGFFTKVEADDMTVALRKGEAYLRVSDLKAPYMFNLAEATGIDNIPWVDGKPAVVYTLQGQRVTAPTKPGVYIVNGKKLVVK